MGVLDHWHPILPADKLRGDPVAVRLHDAPLRWAWTNKGNGPAKHKASAVPRTCRRSLQRQSSIGRAFGTSRGIVLRSGA
jgi:hypothetical protein